MLANKEGSGSKKLKPQTGQVSKREGRRKSPNLPRKLKNIRDARQIRRDPQYEAYPLPDARQLAGVKECRLGRWLQSPLESLVA